MEFLCGFVMFFICHFLINLCENDIYCYIQEGKNERVNDNARRHYLIEVIVIIVIYLAILLISLNVWEIAQYKQAIFIGNGLGFISGSIHFGMIAENNYKSRKVANEFKDLLEDEFNKNKKTVVQTEGILKKGVEYRLTDFIHKEFAVGELEDALVMVTEVPKSQYNTEENCIYISEEDNLTKESFVEALGICLQQAICVVQDINYYTTPMGKRELAKKNKNLSNADYFYELDDNIADENECPICFCHITPKDKNCPNCGAKLKK